MESIKCENKEKAIELLNSVKQFFHAHATREPYNPQAVNLHMSMIDAVQAFLEKDESIK